MASGDARELAGLLLEKAAGDVATLKAVLSSEEVPDEAVGLHAQQAVEKALKAVLASRGVRYPFTHDIDRLVELTEAEAVVLPQNLREAGALTPWALAHRYESAPSLGAAREDMLRMASAAVTWARGLVQFTDE
jgi:HEPN domain-containing protein